MNAAVCGQPVNRGADTCAMRPGHTGYHRSASYVRAAERRLKQRPFEGITLIPDGTELPAEACRNAALVIASNARDADDARWLLAACGLIPSPRGEFRSYSYGRVRQP